MSDCGLDPDRHGIFRSFRERIVKLITKNIYVKNKFKQHSNKYLKLKKVVKPRKFCNF